MAKHLADNYGDRAWGVASMAESPGNRWPLHGIRLNPNYPCTFRPYDLSFLLLTEIFNRYRG